MAGAAIDKQVSFILQRVPIEIRGNLNKQDFVIFPAFNDAVQFAYVYDCNIIFTEKEFFVANADINRTLQYLDNFKGIMPVVRILLNRPDKIVTGIPSINSIFSGRIFLPPCTVLSSAYPAICFSDRLEANKRFFMG